jgi:uncharacterized protein
MRKSLPGLAVVVIYLWIPATIYSQERNYTIDTFQIKSEVLNETRRVIIYKSLHILISDSVKFLYLLDGENSNYRFQRIKEHFSDSISGLIGISIINTDRRRDLLYVNAAGKFLDFITSELIPYVERDYKIKIRILFGHSFGGAFTIYAMINKPAHFNYFIASSPTPIMDLIKKENFQKIDGAGKNRIVFYFSYGSKDMRQVRKWSQKLNANLSELKFEELDWRFEIHDGKNHNNSDIPALIHGLSGLK